MTSLTSKFLCVLLELIGHMLLGQKKKHFCYFLHRAKTTAVREKISWALHNVHVNSFGSY